MKDIENINEDALKENEAIKKAILSGDSDVLKFYDNAVVFLTGGSGFIGKQLIEKLLRSCNIRKIYILIRVKKNKGVDERLKAILDDPVYDELRKEQPNVIDKLVPIEGDSNALNLGIDEANWKKLTEEVNVIFHVAATISFRVAVTTATLTNVRGARELLNLAKTCKNLKSVVHVSTAYAHATRNRVGKEVKEDFYKSPISPETLIELAENMDEVNLSAMIAPLLKDWPNTYTFTKAVAEELVRVQGEGLPICVVRPAIVISAYREPCPGWVDVNNAYGPSGIVLGAILGATHVAPVRNDVNLDFVPVDIVNNVIIVAAYETHNRYVAGKDPIKIYTTTKSRTPFSAGVFNETMHNEVRNIATSKTIWYGFAYFVPYQFIYLLLTWILHYIPAFVFDGGCMLFGQKPRLLKDWPNTYTFTKAVAEELVRVQGEGLPICVVRPAIVISAYREPCPGWVDVNNAYGPSGIVLGAILGATHVAPVRNDVNLDFVPVDIVNNVIIVAAYETHNRYVAGKDPIKIYTTTKSRTPFSAGVFNETMHNEVRNIATSKTIWYGFAYFVPYQFIYLLLTWILHYIPAFVFDGGCMLFGQKPRLFKIYEKYYSMLSVFEYFAKNDWIFQDANTLSMYNNLSQTDKLIYNCDLATVDGRELTYIWAYGVGRFIVKDDYSQRNYALRKQNIFKIVHFVVFPLYLYALFKIALMLFMFVSTIFFMIKSYFVYK